MRPFKVPFIFMSIMSCCVATAASAVYASPLSDAATEYNRAVKQFEIAIYERGYDHQSKRIIQDLEEAAIRMRSASHSPHQRDRLECAWQEIQTLHPHVEAAFFSSERTCSLRPDIGLTQSWHRVSCALSDLARAIACVCNVHGGSSTAPGWLPSPYPFAPSYPDGALPHQEHYQTHPPLSYLPDPRHSSGRIEIPPAVPGAGLPQVAPHIPLDRSSSRPMFQTDPHDRPSNFGQGGGPADAPSVLVDILLRRLASRFGG